MKKSLISLLGLSTLAACALAFANVQAAALPPLVLDPLDNQVMTTDTLPPRPSQGLPGFVPRFSNQESQPKNTMANGYKPLDPIVLAPEDNQVMTTDELPPRPSQGLPGFVPRFSNQETKPKDTMANGYKPLDPIVVAPEDSQVMTTATLPPAPSQPGSVSQEDELESNNHESSESHSEETPSYHSSDDNNYDYSYDYNYNQNYDYNYDYNYNYYYSNDYDYNYNYNYGHYNQYDYNYNTSYYYN